MLHSCPIYLHFFACCENPADSSDKRTMVVLSGPICSLTVAVYLSFWPPPCLWPSPCICPCGPLLAWIPSLRVPSPCLWTSPCLSHASSQAPLLRSVPWDVVGQDFIQLLRKNPWSTWFCLFCPSYRVFGHNHKEGNI